MAAPRKYPDELRERATRMAVELRQDLATKNGAIHLTAATPASFMNRTAVVRLFRSSLVGPEREVAED